MILTCAQISSDGFVLMQINDGWHAVISRVYACMISLPSFTKDGTAWMREKNALKLCALQRDRYKATHGENAPQFDTTALRTSQRQWPTEAFTPYCTQLTHTHSLSLSYGPLLSGLVCNAQRDRQRSLSPSQPSHIVTVFVFSREEFHR